MYGGESGILRVSQFRVLLLGQIQEHPTAPYLKPVIHRQPAFLIRESPGAFYQFDHLVRGCEMQSAGQYSLQVPLQKLAVPAIAGLE